jgi:hypothetical protein
MGAKKIIQRSRSAVKKAINSETGQEVIRKERGIIGDLFIKIGRMFKKK